MQEEVKSYRNGCLRCLRRKAQQDAPPLNVALLVNIETTQPIQLVHLDYLQIDPSKGSIEKFSIALTISQVTHKHLLLKLEFKKYLWHTFILHYGFSAKFISD